MHLYNSKFVTNAFFLRNWSKCLSLQSYGSKRMLFLFSVPIRMLFHSSLFSGEELRRGPFFVRRKFALRTRAYLVTMFGITFDEFLRTITFCNTCNERERRKRHFPCSPRIRKKRTKKCRSNKKQNLSLYSILISYVISPHVYCCNFDLYRNALVDGCAHQTHQKDNINC